MVTLQNASTRPVDFMMHELMHLDYAARKISSWNSFTSTFQFEKSGRNAGASGLRACRADTDCGGDFCQTAGDNNGNANIASTLDFAPNEQELRRWDTVNVCVSRPDGMDGRRYQGGVRWYDLGTSDHAFIATATMYRWYGDELGKLVASDVAAGNLQLQRRYNWIKDSYFGGIEYNGNAAPTNKDRNAGDWGVPNR